MAKEIGKLSVLKIQSIKNKGLYADGNNLYLKVTAAGSKAWLFRFMLNGKAREMGLGSLNAVSLAEARIKAADARKLCSENIDPIEARKGNKAKKALEDARAKTFRQCAEAYIESHRTGWKNKKHASQWENTLATYAYPVFGDISVQDIDVTLVMKALEPIWAVKTETASRVRGRIESIIDWASAREYRTGENPARWRGKLENLLPKRSKVQKVQHHPALVCQPFRGHIFS